MYICVMNVPHLHLPPATGQVCSSTLLIYVHHVKLFPTYMCG